MKVRVLDSFTDASKRTSITIEFSDPPGSRYTIPVQIGDVKTTTPAAHALQSPTTSQSTKEVLRPTPPSVKGKGSGK